MAPPALPPDLREMSASEASQPPSGARVPEPGASRVRPGRPRKGVGTRGLVIAVVVVLFVGALALVEYIHH